MIAGFAYRGKDGEAYSPLNHFISELGEVGVSRFAWVFNLSLITAGVSLIGASTSLGLILPGLLAKIGMVCGIICSIALAFVGVFPMNKMEPHRFAAKFYFRTGLSMMILFSLAIAIQPADLSVLPKTYSLAGLPAICSFASFLFLIRKPTEERDDNLISTKDIVRQKVWTASVVEWSIFLTSVIWFVVIAIGL